MDNNASKTALDAIKSVLKEKLVSDGILAEPGRLLTFLSSLQGAYSTVWSQAYLWKLAQITQTLSLGGVDFRTLTEDASPEQLLRAATEIIEEHWDTVEQAFEKSSADLQTAASFLAQAKSANSATEARNHLEALIASLSVQSDQQKQVQIELPAGLKQAFTDLRDKTKDIEKAWIETLGLGNVPEKLEQALQKLTTKKESLKNAWTEQQEKNLQETRRALEELQKWQEKVVAERKKVVESSFNETGSQTFSYVNKQEFSKIFFEHAPLFKPGELSIVLAQVEAFWKLLSKEDVTTRDPDYYFDISVIEIYQKFRSDLEKKLAELTPLATALTSRILSVLGLAPSGSQAPAPDGGGADSDQDTQPKDPDRTARQKSRWILLLERLSTLNQGISGIPESEILSGVVTSLQQFAKDVGVSAPDSKFEKLVGQLLGVGFESWTTDETLENIDAILDRFVQLLVADEELLAQAKNAGVTPGEAAEKAKELQEEQEKQAEDQRTAPPSPNSTDNLDLTKLKDLSKLHHAHAALTGIALAELEQLLIKENYSKAEIEKYLIENQPALAQYLWGEYLSQLQGGTTSTLSSNEVFRLALNGSWFFVDKFKLEKGDRTEAIGPNSLKQGEKGELSREMLLRLSDVAQMYGYGSADEMFVALFGNGDKAQARADFIRRAEYAATLTPEKIEAFSRSLIEQYLGANGPQAGDSLIERLMASLDRDQYSLEQLFVQDPDSLSPSQKAGWRELGSLLKRYSNGQVLSPKDIVRMDKLLLEMSPILVLYMNLGPEFFTLRQGNGFREFLVQASHYGAEEDRQAQASGSADTYQRLIPERFYTPGTPVMALRLQVDAEQVTVIRQTRISRNNIGFKVMISASLSAKGAASSFDDAYLEMTRQELDEAGIPNPPGNIAATQRGGDWASQTAQQTGGSGGTKQLLAQASGKKGGPLNILGNFKDPLVRKAVMSAAKAIVGFLAPYAGMGLAGLLGAQALLYFFPFLKPLVPVWLGGTSGASSSTAVMGTGSQLGGSASPFLTDLAGTVTEGSKTAASQVGINAKALVGDLAAKTGESLSSAGTTVSGALAAVTTTASTSASIIAAGIVVPMLSMVTITMLVWAVIGNSFNDYGGLKTVQGVGKNYCAEDNPSLADTAKGLVADLQPGWWKYYNRHPAYPELFNTAAYNAYPNKTGVSVNDYTEPDYYVIQGQSANTQRDLFWCTWLIIKAYQINNLPIGQNIYVPSMLSKWSAGPVIKNKAGVPGGPNIKDDPIAAQSIPLGAAIFFGKNQTYNAGNSVAGGAHVAIVCDITFDDAAKTTGTLTTCDSNNYKTLNDYNIINGVVQDSDTLQVDYFGLPGETLPSCNATPLTPVSFMKPTQKGNYSLK